MPATDTPASHPHPWRRSALFGSGPRVALTREERAVWRWRIEAARRAGRLTAAFAYVGHALIRRLGTDGRLDPSHDTIAADAGVSARTARRALAVLAGLGFVRWTQRLVRDGWRTAQTSNAYALTVSEASLVRENLTFRVSRPPCPPQQPAAASPDSHTAREAQQALARRRAALLGKWNAAWAIVAIDLASH